MLIETLSTFPHMYDSVMGESMMKRAQEKGILDFRAYDLRDWTYDRHRTTDDDPYGGGAGLVMKCEPIFEAVEAIAGKGCVAAKLASAEVERRGVPGGARQASSAANAISPVGCRAERGLSERPSITRNPAPEDCLSEWACPPPSTEGNPAPQKERLLFVCGHYEGIDERVYSLADHIISLGDYVLTSGELASMVVIDAVVRKIPGVLGAADGPIDESFTSGLLEYPQYTRPANFRGMEVPAVLLSGNHAAVARWRREQSLARTAEARPDLLAAFEKSGRLTAADQKFLLSCKPGRRGESEAVS